jgi:hypothetical protein
VGRVATVAYRSRRRTIRHSVSAVPQCAKARSLELPTDEDVDDPQVIAPGQSHGARPGHGVEPRRTAGRRVTIKPRHRNDRLIRQALL